MHLRTNLKKGFILHCSRKSQIKNAHKRECGQNIGASNSIIRKPKDFTGMQIVYKRKVESYNCTHNAVGM